jgi:hypothetical protein
MASQSLSSYLICRVRQCLVVLALAPLAAAMLCSCSSTVLSQMPSSVGGIPAGTPERPTAPGAYPAVYDMPPPRDDAVLTNDQQQQVQDDLIAARDRQVKRSGAAQ